MRKIGHIIATIFFFTPFSILFAQTVLFVSKNGNSENSGSIDSPLTSVNEAILKLKVLRKNAGIIYLREGDYQLRKSIFISEVGNKGLRSVIISGYKSEVVTLSGDKKVDTSNVLKLNSGSIWDRLPDKAKNKIYVIDLIKEGLPHMNMKQYGYGIDRKPVSLELFQDNRPLTMSRWPNDSLLSIGKVIQNGSRFPIGGERPKFIFNTAYLEKWKTTKDVWVSGRFSVGWANDNVEVDSIDRNNKIITLKDYLSYGVTSSNDIKKSKTGKGFYFYNVLEELDNPGEWYLDRDNQKAYVWPLNNNENSNWRLSFLEEPLVKIVRSKGITFQNLNFATSRGNGVEVDSSSNISFVNCSFSNLGLQAIVTTGCKNFLLKNSKIAGTGGGGITIDGGDRKELISANNQVENCEFQDYSRLYRSYSPAITLQGVGAKVTHNFIHNAPDQAILYSGNDHWILNNHIKNVCYDFDDMGAIYTGRDPSSTGTVIENNLFENVENESSNSIAAVYIDDGSGGIQVNNNLFYSSGGHSISGFGAIHVNGGSNNNFINNVFVNCTKAFSATSWTDRQWIDLYFKNPTYRSRLTKTVDIRSNVYQSKYTYLKDFFDSTHIAPRMNFIANSIAYKVTRFSTGSIYKQENVFITNENPGFEDPERHRFNLVKRPLGTINWKNWKQFDFTKIRIN